MAESIRDPRSSLGAMDSFDLIIVGSGSGNSIPDYLKDWRIAIVERGVFGGTCLNVGCIPSKMFIVPADLAESARNGTKLGVDSHVDGVDWAQIRDRVFGRIDPISAGGEEYRATGNANIELIRGTAVFVDSHTFEVEGRQITAPKILLAAGARPYAAPIPGLDEVAYQTSDSIMRLDTLPKRLGVIGAGFIAVELGHVFSSYGSQVTMFNRSDSLLRTQDAEVARRFTEIFGRRVDLVLNADITEVRTTETGIAVTANGEDHEFDELLVATGRRPNSDLLAAEVAGLELSEDGRVVTDASMQTSVEGIWATGDLTNSYQLKHLANAETSVAFWNIANSDQPRQTNYSAVPHAVFSNPQVASVGLTEEQAKADGVDYVVGRRDYGGTAYGWALEDSESFAKVLIERSSKKIVGGHIIGPQAATLIQPLIQAMHFGQPADEVAKDVFYIHPALTEVVENALLDALDGL